MDKQNTKRLNNLVVRANKLNKKMDKVLEAFAPPTDEGLRDMENTIVRVFELMEDEEESCPPIEGNCLLDSTEETRTNACKYCWAKYLLSLLQQVIERDYVKLDKDQTEPVNPFNPQNISDITIENAYR